MGNQSHWENVFSTKAATEVSWYQKYPQVSIDFVKEMQLPFDAKIIDIGGGDSYFIDALLALGYTNLYLLDISEKAIERIKKRLGTEASKVTFIVADILDFKSETQFDLWHDRACFHFLVAENEIEAYVKKVGQSIAQKGQVILGTFSIDGPKKCSGLGITQYSATTLNGLFKDDFGMVATLNSAHQTPFDTIQNFTFCHFIKK